MEHRQDPSDGAQALIYALEREGVEYIFGYSGGAAIPIFDAIVTTNTKIKMILARHEQGAAHMADGYARVSGKPGVVLVTSGPGAGNTITGLMTAHMDSVPIIVISGQQIRPMLGMDAFQEADIFNMTMPVVKHNYLVDDTQRIPEIVKQAFAIATSGRPGPVLIDVPKDVSSGAFIGSMPEDTRKSEPKSYTRPEATGEDVQYVVAALKKAKRPVILAGHGVLISGAQAELATLANQFQVPVTTTLLGKGAFNEQDALSLGMLGMHGTAYANKAIIDADLVLNIGSRFDDRIIGKADEFAARAVKIHVDIDKSEFNKMITVDRAIRADAKAFLNQIMQTGQSATHSSWLRKVDGFKHDFPLTYKNSGTLN